MQRLPKLQRQSLVTAVSRYREAFAGSDAEEYLAQRGLTQLDGFDRFRFGFVKNPLPEHEQYEGKLAIPYLRWHPRYGWTCVSIRFRTLGTDKAKYLTLSGDKPRLFNTPVLNQPVDEVGISEGELDAATATLCGLPTVGVPGSTAWQPFWAELFRGYKTVHVFADGDGPGEKFARQVAKALPNARVLKSPPGEDLNDLLTQHGVEAVQQRWKGQQ